MELKDFKEFIRNKRRNEFLQLKQTKKYGDNPQGYDEMYADVNDEVMSGLHEKLGRNTRPCHPRIRITRNRFYSPLKWRSDQFVSNSENYLARY